MPIYEYRCQACQELSEVFVRGGKEPTACEHCGENALQKLISRAGVIFKGSGFYVNDSKGSSTASKPASDATSSNGTTDSKSSTESSTSTTKTESISAASKSSSSSD